MADTDKPPVRTHVTLEYKGDQPHAFRLARRGGPPIVVTLVQGDNEVPIDTFHLFGLHQPTADLIVAGIIAPVCRTHTYHDSLVNPDHCRDCPEPRYGDAS